MKYVFLEPFFVVSVDIVLFRVFIIYDYNRLHIPHNEVSISVSPICISMSIHLFFLCFHFVVNSTTRTTTLMGE
jgi:hypothetical protein